MIRYAIGLTDTVKVTANSSVCLTEGSKTPTEYIFRFEEEPKEKSSISKSTNGSGKRGIKAESDASPPKVKPLNGVAVGSKVLRGKTRQQLLDPEASKSVQAKIAGHQKELHIQRQQDGLARFAGDDGVNTEDNRKTWKRFQSYKGEAGLPKEAESLRVNMDIETEASTPTYTFPVRFMLIAGTRLSLCPSTGSLSHFILTLSSHPARVMRENTLFSVSISRFLALTLVRRKMQYVPSLLSHCIPPYFTSLAI